ncbi:hypothetical protein V8C44DRAFT_321433 [Trichoderma aethiopicum]
MPRFCRSSPDFSYCYQIFAPSPLDCPQTLRCPTAVAPLQQRLHDALPCPALPIFFLAASCSASSNMLALARQERARSRAMDTLCYDALPLQNKVATGSPSLGRRGSHRQPPESEGSERQRQNALSAEPKKTWVRNGPSEMLLNIRSSSQTSQQETLEKQSLGERVPAQPRLIRLVMCECYILPSAV